MRRPPPSSQSSRLKEHLGTDAEAINIGRDLSLRLAEAFLVEILKLDFQVGIQIPVDAQFESIQFATVNGSVVQIQIVITGRKLPSAPTPRRAAIVVANPPKWRVWPGDVGAALSAVAAVVNAVLTGQEIRDLDVTTFKASFANVSAVNDNAMGRRPSVLRLEGERPPHVKQLQP